MNGPTFITQYFGTLEEPRVKRTRRHELTDIVTLAVCAIVGGADSWVDVALFGKSKLAWFKQFLDLPNGIPSHDTFGRVFARLDPDAFAACFRNWIDAIATELNALGDRVIAIDGKTLRRSFDRASGKSPLHLVSAFATDLGLVLAQVATDVKSNEITAIPRLLALLDLKGATITIDAMGCQKKIVEAIVEAQADYLLSLKGNQSTLHREVAELFEDAEKNGFADLTHAYAQTVDGDHGRIETRRCWCTSDVDWYTDRDEWRGLRSFGLVESTREIAGKPTTVERRYFIGSLAGTDATRFLSTVRAHWGIENGLHWVLDIAFREDESRVRKDHAPQNFAMLRHIALNMIKREKTSQGGVAARRKRAGWEEDYLLKVLAVGNE